MKYPKKGTYSILTYSNIFLIFSILSLTINSANAQHHGAPPPVATIGDRNIQMNFVTYQLAYVIEPLLIDSSS
jgi:hypothetical protein